MDFLGLDLNLLVVLDALFTERNVTKAGERLNLSQPATSAALGRLRAYFQDDLMVQTGRSMLLTSHAEDLVQPVRDILLRAESIAKHSSGFDQATAVRTFRLKMSDYVASVLMPDLVQTVRKLAPGVTLDIQSNHHGAVESLERGEVDLLIMPQQYLSKDHPSEVLFEDSYVCAVWSGNRLVGRRMTPALYWSLPHGAVKYSELQMPILEEWLASHHGRRRRIVVLSMAFSLLPQLVVGTDLVATMHARLARKFAADLPLRLLASPLEMPKLVECAQWHRYRSLDPGVQWLRSLLVAVTASPRRRRK